MATNKRLGVSVFSPDSTRIVLAGRLVSAVEFRERYNEPGRVFPLKIPMKGMPDLEAFMAGRAMWPDRMGVGSESAAVVVAAVDGSSPPRELCKGHAASWRPCP